MDQFIFGILPYIAFTFLIAGTVVRYTVFERNWTTKSSQFLSKSDLKFAGLIFHLGVVMAFGGHVIGILIPKTVTEAAGIDQHLYHMVALGGGIPAGILFLGGFLLLLKRRFAGKSRMAVSTSTMDKWLYLVLFITIVTGCWGTISGMPADNTFNYRDTISPWFRSVLVGAPDISYMETVPFYFRLHMLGWMATAMLFPFTRLVHCLSFPFEYFLRSDIVYRRK